jgi:hypothetical protein
MTTLGDALVPDELWAIVEPLLPVPPRPPYGGRRHGLVAGEHRYHERAGPAWGIMWANPVDRGKPGSKLHLVCDGAAYPSRSW